MVSPTPINLTGTSNSSEIVITIPPFAVPSSFVNTIPVSSVISPNSFA